MSAIGFQPTEELALFDDKWFVVYSLAPASPDSNTPALQTSIDREPKSPPAVPPQNR
jgi:hypothetical protein